MKKMLLPLILTIAVFAVLGAWAASPPPGSTGPVQTIHALD